MNLYLAAAFNSDQYPGSKSEEFLSIEERNTQSKNKFWLESYHYINDRMANKILDSGHKIFLDSGAFSAWTLGHQINLPKYCQFIEKNKDFVIVEDGVMLASVLDGIGDPLLTYQNQKWMESLGVTPLPCFHIGEDERYLEHYVKNYPYITLGGMVGVSVKTLTQWLDRIWNKHLLDGSGRPKLKVHGFGLTSITMMEQYPWWSVDSSSWIQFASFGNILLPNHGPVAVSEDSPKRFTANQHFKTMPKIIQEHILNIIEEHQFDIERLKNHYQCRRVFNLNSFRLIAQEITEKYNHDTFIRKTQELF